MDKLSEGIKRTHGKRLDKHPPEKQIEYLRKLEPKLKEKQDNG